VWGSPHHLVYEGENIENGDWDVCDFFLLFLGSLLFCDGETFVIPLR
jgi:hypothetical protein